MGDRPRRKTRTDPFQAGVGAARSDEITFSVRGPLRGTRPFGGDPDGRRPPRCVKSRCSVNFRTDRWAADARAHLFGVSREQQVSEIARGRRLIYFGCATTRRYGLRVFQPIGNFCLACSSVTEVGMITSSPGFQFTGVATLCLAVSCSESSTRNTSSKLRPLDIG